MKTVHLIVGIMLILVGCGSLAFIVENNFVATFILKLFGTLIVFAGAFYVIKTLRLAK